MRSEDYQAVVEQLLASIGNESAFQQCLATIMSYVGADKFLFVYQQDAGNPQMPLKTLHRGLSDKYSHAYSSYYRGIDEWCHWQSNYSNNHFYCEREAIPYQQYLNSEIYVDLYREMDVHDTLSVNLKRQQDLHYMAAFFKGKTSQHFSNGTARLLDRLLPYLTLHVDMQKEMDSYRLENGRLLKMLDCIDDNVYLVDSHMKLLYSNQSASQCLERGMCFEEYFGTLKAKKLDVSIRLKQAVNDAMQWYLADSNKATSTVVFRNRLGRMMQIHVSPVSTSTLALGGQNESVVAMLRIPVEKPVVDRRDIWQQLYQLTIHEIAIAQALCSGSSIEEISNLRRTSKQTVRTQIKNIMQKTGTHSQVELVLLLINLH